MELAFTPLSIPVAPVRLSPSMSAWISVEIRFVPEVPAPLAETPTAPALRAADPEKTRALISARSLAKTLRLPPEFTPELIIPARISDGDSSLLSIQPIRFSAVATPIDTPTALNPPDPKATEAAITLASILEALSDCNSTLPVECMVLF